MNLIENELHFKSKFKNLVQMGKKPYTKWKNIETLLNNACDYYFNRFCVRNNKEIELVSFSIVVFSQYSFNYQLLPYNVRLSNLFYHKICE